MPSDLPESLLPTLDSVARVPLLPELDGRHGSNRAAGNHPLITADTDLDALHAWLARFVDTKTTFDNYRKEAERLLLWAHVELHKPISSLTHEDLLAYQQFLADPQPASRWIMPKGRKAARSHPDWRPFAGPLAPSSQRQAILILNAMFSWLVNAGYLAGNPLSLSRQRARKAKPRITRYLEEELWSEVKRTIDQLPKESKREREHYCRLRWLFSLMYVCGLRISEVNGNTMGNFFCRHDKAGQERWWLEVTGKGDKTRIIPATNELMVELAQYRREMGLAPFPLSGEATPLLLPIGGKHRVLSRGGLHAIVKQVFERTALRLRQNGEENASLAKRIEQASAHWLRHTAGSHMANQDIDLRHVRDTLGHESISTTSHYLHSSDDERHREIELRHKLKW